MQMGMERHEVEMRAALDAEEMYCAWAVGEYEAAEREMVVERRRAGVALKRAQRRAAKATMRYSREEAERQRVELVANIKREAREDIRTMRALRRAEHIEARLVSLTARTLSEARRRGGRRWAGAQPNQRCRHRVVTFNGLDSLCREVGRNYAMLMPAVYAMFADVIPASVVIDEISKIRSKRGFFFGADASTSSALLPMPALLVSEFISILFKCCVWRVGACHIERMCRHGYG